MPWPLPTPLPFRVVQPLWSGPLPTPGPLDPPWPVDITEMTGLWLPVQVSGSLCRPPRLLHGPASTGTGQAGLRGRDTWGQGCARRASCPGCPQPTGGGGAHSGPHSISFTCEPLVWVADGAAKASGPAVCWVGHHGCSCPRPGAGWPTWESRREPSGQVRSVLGGQGCCSSLGSAGWKGHAGREWACVQREGEQGWGQPVGGPCFRHPLAL